MEILSDVELLESVFLAKRLGLDEDFLALLLEEVERRKIDIPNGPLVPGAKLYPKAGKDSFA